MVCPSGKIRNPKTGRCVGKDGKIGRNVLGKSPLRKKRKTPVRRQPRKRRSLSRQGRKSAKKCAGGQILNPKTGRCVKRSGKIGREILGKSPVRRKRKSPTRKRKRRTKPKSRTRSKSRSKPPRISPVKPVGIPSKFKKIAKDCAELGNWEKKEFLGEGAYGQVYTACRAGNCDYVLKTQKNDAGFKHEVKALYALNNWQYSPKIYAAWTCKGEGYLIEEKVVKCNHILKKDKYKQLKHILAELHKKHWVFVDIHSGNVMCKPGGKKVILIDFGWARHLLPGQTVKQGTHRIADLLERSANFQDLEAAERSNLEYSFGILGSSAENEASLNWENRVKRIKAN